MRRDIFIGVKLNPTEHDRLRQMMQATGRTASDVFRRMLTIAEIRPDISFIDGPPVAGGRK